MSVNKIILLGHLGRDPECRYFQDGTPVANFSLATSERWTNKGGEKQERTEWHRIEVTGKTADVVRDYCKKGKQVYIEGSIHYDEWTDKEGAKRNTTKIRVSGFNSRLVLLGGRGDGDSPSEYAPRARDRDDGELKPSPGQAYGNPAAEVDDSDVPF